MILSVYCFFFFFSSRRRHTRSLYDWSSDVCSSDLDYWQELHPASAGGAYVNFLMDEGQDRVKASYRGNYDRLARSEERRVGKECRSRGSPDHSKNKKSAEK